MYRNSISAARSPVGYDQTPQRQQEISYQFSSLNCSFSHMWSSTTINLIFIAALAACNSTI